MSEWECGKCETELKVTDEIIKTRDHLVDCGIRKERVLVCESCNRIFYIKEE